MSGSTLTTPSSVGEFPVYNALVPKEGPKCLPYVLPFNLGPGPYVIDCQQVIAQRRISLVQSVYIDNSAGSEPVTMTVAGSNQVIDCPSGAQGYFPVLAPNPARFTFASAGSVDVNVSLANVPVPAAVWSATSQTSIADEANGPVTPGAPATESKLAGAIYYASGTAPTPVSGDQQALQIDDTGALRTADAALATATTAYEQGPPTAVYTKPLGGISSISLASASTTTPATPASTQLIQGGPYNGAWTYIGIQAPTTADVWINPRGGTAGVGLADCIRIAAGTFYESKSPAIGGPVTYYCATGNLQLTAFYA